MWRTVKDAHEIVEWSRIQITDKCAKEILLSCAKFDHCIVKNESIVESRIE